MAADNTGTPAAVGDVCNECTVSGRTLSAATSATNRRNILYVEALYLPQESAALCAEAQGR